MKEDKPKIKCEKDGCHETAQVEIRRVHGVKKEYLCTMHAEGLKHSGVKIVSEKDI